MAQSNDKDVTDQVKIGGYGEGCATLVQCVCGRSFPRWNHILSDDRDMAVKCPLCGRKLYVTMTIHVFEVVE